MPKEPKVQLPLRVPESYIERLDELADKMDLERSEVARRALRNGITELEKLTKLGANPVANMLASMVTLMDADAEEREEVQRVLRALMDHKKGKKLQDKLIRETQA